MKKNVKYKQNINKKNFNFNVNQILNIDFS